MKLKTSSVGRRLSRRAGFTLIELLVVIAIIALLISVLLPSLQKAKAMAVSVACANQMRAYNVAIQCYVTEYNQIPWFRFSGSSPNADDLWHNVLKPWIGLGMSETDDDRRKCPSGEAWIGCHYGGDNPSGIPAAPFVYAEYSGIKGKAVTLEATADPSSWALLMDAEFRYVYTPVTSYWKFKVDTDNDGEVDSMSSTQQYNLARPRVHNDGCNVALADGHVEWVAFNSFFALDDSGMVSHTFWWK